jgi:hypothetical protein
MTVRPLIRLFSVCVAICLSLGHGHAQQASAASPQLNDLDAFMAKVLERRTDNWRALHEFILSERERFLISGPGGLRLDGSDREFHWFVKDGYLVRGPVKANGVAVGDTERRTYEEKWLAGEKRREQRQIERDAKKTAASVTPAPSAEAGATDAVRQTGEPRFISEAYFMRFPFEPGNYYLAGRDTIEGRAVVVIEYYPSRLFNDDRRRDAIAAGKPAPHRHSPEMEAEIQRDMNKVSRVTMWIDQQERQIVKYTFDNADFGFLPGRAIVRVDEARATMLMGRYFDNVWLPKQISVTGGATLATGTYNVTYERSFYDYRRGEVTARIRAYVPKDDK